MQVVKQVSGLWQTLQTWLHPATTPVSVPMSDWWDIARRQSRCAFVVWLAEEVARDLRVSKPRNLSVEALAQSVWTCESSGLQQRAEHFLKNFYYCYPSTDPHYFDLLRIFRHLVQKKLRPELH